MSIVFTGGRVITGNGPVLGNTAVCIEKNRIVDVVPNLTELPEGTRVIPVDGSTLLPGFIDCHVHLCMDGSPDPMAAIMAETPVATTLKAARMARETILGGVTTIRDMGGKDGIDLGIKQSIADGLIPGPRMLVSGKLICMTGGHGWPIGREANGVDDVRRAAREQIKAGADIVKLMATGGVLTPAVEPGSEQLTEDELRAGIEEAHKAGRKTATHAMGTRGIMNALRAGIDTIEHGVYLDDATVAYMIEHDVAYIPTIAALYNIEVNGVEAGIPDWAVAKTMKVKPHHLASVRMAREAGVKIAMGTDAGTPFTYHGRNLDEIRLLEELGGFAPLAAIESGTRVAAEVLGLDDQIGTIEKGKLADLIVVAGNPLDDLKILSDADNIKVVMQDGKFVNAEPV